ncbi:MAG: hypothetical protein ACI8P9_000720 [Parasphingorhabdus sp.]|jgi:hypothetical protein
MMTSRSTIKLSDFIRNNLFALSVIVVASIAQPSYAESDSNWLPFLQKTAEGSYTPSGSIAVILPDTMPEQTLQ